MKYAFALLVLALIAATSAERVKGQLPDYTGPNITQWTGYINLPDGKNYFYWLVESENDPVTDPLVVWYQGGPGCSGLIGLFTENGPYQPDGMGGIQYNPATWTKFANVLFIEQPAGVGFSTANSTEGLTTNDTQAAIDNFNFLEMWLELYKSYQGRPTWLAGESYAGVYIPTLTSVIMNATSSIIANQLVGFTIGNPVISCVSADYNAIQMDLFYYHALVSWTVYKNWTTNACYLDSGFGACPDIFNTAVEQIGVIYQQKRQTAEPSLDPDCLYQDFCTGNGTLEFSVNQGYPNGCNPVGSQMATYLNRKDVQSLIGIADPIVWTMCGNIDYTTLGLSMIPYYDVFFETYPKLQIMIYSGDVDIYTVPFGYTKACLGELEEVATSVWQPWFVNGATAGYVETFPHYTYATIKGAGHEAPQYQPLISYELFYRFITGGSLLTEGPAQYERLRTQSRVLKEHGIQG